MHHEPHRPCRPAVDAQLPDFGHGAVAPHGRHDARIAVSERHHRPSRRLAAEVVREAFSLLNGGLRQLGVPVRIVRIASQDALVSDRVDVVVPFHAVEGIDADTAPAARGQQALVSDAFGFDAAHPDEGQRGQPAPVVEHHAAVAVVRNLFAEQNLHAHAAQKTPRGIRRGGRHSGQQTVARFDQMDAHPLRRKIRIVARQHETLHFGERSGDLDARCASARDDHVQQFVAFALRGRGERPFEVRQQRIAQCRRLRDALHRQRVAPEVFVSVEVGRRARGQHEFVVLQRPDRGPQGVALRVDGLRFGHSEVEIALFAEDPAERKRDRRGLQTGRRHLINQRLELMIVVPVHEHHLIVRSAQPAGELHSCETAADDYDPPLRGSWYIETHRIAIVRPGFLPMRSAACGASLRRRACCGLAGHLSCRNRRPAREMHRPGRTSPPCMPLRRTSLRRGPSGETAHDVFAAGLPTTAGAG